MPHFFRILGMGLLPIWMIATGTAGTFHVDNRDEFALVKRKVRASQFLHRATFGPTIEQIESLATRMQQVGVRRACDEWIEEQFSLDASLHQPLIEAMIADDNLVPTQDDVWIHRFRHHAWWHQSLAADDQLRQRVAWALVQILVTSDQGAGFNDRNVGNVSNKARWLGPTNYYDVLVNNAFGNYGQILKEVTYHPCMGIYLSHMRNRKSNGVRFPDENYAREIMQLFSIGLYELQLDGRLKRTPEGELIPTYDNETIKNFARVFTGLTFKPRVGGHAFWSGNDFQYPMEMYQPEHDTEPKTLLNGVVTDLDDGNADIAAALQNLMDHDNVAPFISYRLIQRLVKSNPSRGYIRRVARKFNDNGQGVKGDMKAVIKAILLDPEAWRAVRMRGRRNPYRVMVTSRGAEYSRLREPVIRYTNLLRGLHANSDYHTGRMMVLPMNWHWEQEPYKQPSVFNFFDPNYQPPGDLLGHQPSRRIPNGELVAPEFQQKTAVTSNRLINRYIWDISSQRSRHFASNANYTMECNLNFDFTAEKALATNDADMPKLIDLFDLVFCCGSMPDDYKARIVEVVNQETEWMRNNNEWKHEFENARVESALIAVTTSPFCAVSR
ncbi:MAG: DUF1800 domain-containing protein [Rubripirellula sp.]